MKPSPVQPAQRIHYLDLLRGFAITGVLLAYIFWNLGNAPAGTYTTLDRILDLVANFVVDSKCYTLLACLFTVGFVLHMQKTGDKTARLLTYRRRLLGLLIIGWLHALLLRNGDILAPYALLALLVTFFYNFSNRALVITLVLVFLVQALLPQFWLRAGFSFPQRPEGVSGNYWVENFAWVKYWYTTAIFFWEGTLVLLLGGLLLGRIFIQQKKEFSKKQVALITGSGFIAGTLGYVIVYYYNSWIGTLPDIGNTMVVRAIAYRLIELIYRAGLVAAYAGVIYLLSRNFRMNALSVMGRTSLTNYILQALIIVPVALAFNLFDRMTPTLAFVLTIATWLIQYLFSRWWLKQYRFGPLEWVLRRFTYGRSVKSLAVSY